MTTRNLYLLDALAQLAVRLEMGITRTPLTTQNKRLWRDACLLEDLWCMAGRLSPEEAFESQRGRFLRYTGFALTIDAGEFRAVLGRVVKFISE